MMHAKRASQAPAALALHLPTVWPSWPVAALWLLVLGSAVNHYSFKLFGLSVYAENVALGLAVPLVGLAVARGALQWYWPRPLLPLSVWLAVALMASVLNAPRRVHSLLLWNKLLLVVAVYVIVANLARQRMLSTVGAQCLAGIGVAAFGLLAFTSWKLTGSHWGMEHAADNLGRAWLPHGTQREPNILGSYLVAAVLLGLGVAASRARMPAWLRLVAWSAVILGIPGVILTGARTVWIALVVALGVGLLVMTIHRPRVVVRRAVLPLLALLLVVGAMAALHFDPRTLIPAFNPHQTGSIMQRIASFGSLSRERDLTVRVEIYRNALTHWQQHPWIGWGVGAYGEVYRYPYPDQVHPGWISNLFIHVLYDSGLLGLAFFFGGLVWAGCRGVRAWRGAQGIEAGMLAGTLLALLGLLIAFQSTEATWFAYPWIYLGLLEGAIFSAGRRSRPEHLTVTPRMWGGPR